MKKRELMLKGNTYLPAAIRRFSLRSGQFVLSETTQSLYVTVGVGLRKMAVARRELYKECKRRGLTDIMELQPIKSYDIYKNEILMRIIVYANKPPHHKRATGESG